MLRIVRPQSAGCSGSTVYDLQVSTVAELPNLGSEIESGHYIAAGSIAQVIQAGAFYTLDENGTWYDESGEAAS